MAATDVERTRQLLASVRASVFAERKQAVAAAAAAAAEPGAGLHEVLRKPASTASIRTRWQQEWDAAGEAAAAAHDPRRAAAAADDPWHGASLGDALRRPTAREPPPPSGTPSGPPAVRRARQDRGAFEGESLEDVLRTALHRDDERRHPKPASRGEAAPPGGTTQQPRAHARVASSFGDEPLEAVLRSGHAGRGRRRPGGDGDARDAANSPGPPDDPPPPRDDGDGALRRRPEASPRPRTPSTFGDVPLEAVLSARDSRAALPQRGYTPQTTPRDRRRRDDGFGAEPLEAVLAPCASATQPRRRGDGLDGPGPDDHDRRGAARQDPWQARGSTGGTTSTSGATSTPRDGGLNAGCFSRAEASAHDGDERSPALRASRGAARGRTPSPPPPPAETDSPPPPPPDDDGGFAGGGRSRPRLEHHGGYVDTARRRDYPRAYSPVRTAAGSRGGGGGAADVSAGRDAAASASARPRAASEDVSEAVRLAEAVREQSLHDWLLAPHLRYEDAETGAREDAAVAADFAAMRRHREGSLAHRRREHDDAGGGLEEVLVVRRRARAAAAEADAYARLEHETAGSRGGMGVDDDGRPRVDDHGGWGGGLEDVLVLRRRRPDAIGSAAYATVATTASRTARWGGGDGGEWQGGLGDILPHRAPPPRQPRPARPTQRGGPGPAPGGSDFMRDSEMTYDALLALDAAPRASESSKADRARLIGRALATAVWKTPAKEDECDTACVICLEDFVDREKVKKLPCKHVYHNACIRKWLQQDMRCPTCRAAIPGCDAGQH